MLRSLLAPLRGAAGAAGAAALSFALLGGAQPARAFASPENSSDSDAGPVPPGPVLDPNAFIKFRLTSVEALTPDTKRYTFALPRASDSAGLAAASFVLVRAPAGPDGAPLVRPYTPTSHVDTRGSFELVVKAYGPAPPAASTGVGSYLSRLPLGAEIEVKGPVTKFAYAPNTWRGIGMVAGGTGITPMLQLLRAILDNPRDRTEVRLIYANKSEADIMLRAELDALAAKHPQFKVVYTLDNAPAGWQGEKGFVSAEMIRSSLPPPVAPGADGSVPFKIFVCGPPPMMRSLAGEKKSPSEQGELTGLLSQLGYDAKAVFKY